MRTSSVTVTTLLFLRLQHRRVFFSRFTTAPVTAACPLSNSPALLYRRLCTSQKMSTTQAMTASVSAFNIPSVMPCVTYSGEPNQMQFDATRPTPQRGVPGRVLVRVEAAGINPVDAKEVVGDKLPRHWTATRRLVRQRLLRNKIWGFDFSGIVVDRPGHQGYEPGQAVVGTMPPLEGSCAAYISAPVDQLCLMSIQPTISHNGGEEEEYHNQSDDEKDNPFVQAAVLPLVGLTALQCLKRHIAPPPPVSEEETTSSLLQSQSTATTTTRGGGNGTGTSVLVVGASGGTGHVAVQVARNLGATHVTAVCSKQNFNFCQSLGATHTVDYRNNNNDNDNNNTSSSSLSTLPQRLRAAPGWPFDVVMDCVTSDDPRDAAAVHYPTVLQDPSHALLAPQYVYRRLGGPTPDWIRASMERWAGLADNPMPPKKKAAKVDTATNTTSSSSTCCWRNRHEKLFWIRFPESADELRLLQEWVAADKLRVQVARVYPMTAEDVQQAFDETLARRVQGKLAVRVRAP